MSAVMPPAIRDLQCLQRRAIVDDAGGNPLAVGQRHRLDHDAAIERAEWCALRGDGGSAIREHEQGAAGERCDPCCGFQ